jgi:hypothetical protein
MTDMMQAESDVPLSTSALWPALQQGTAFAQSLAAALAAQPAVDAPVRGPLVQNAMRTALASVSTTLIAANAQCRRLLPPKPITEVVADGQNGMVYRCTHTTPHYFTLDGKPI